MVRGNDMASGPREGSGGRANQSIVVVVCSCCSLLRRGHRSFRTVVLRCVADARKRERKAYWIFFSLNLWRPPSVALYLKRSHVLGTCRKAVVASLFCEIMLT